MKRLRCIKIYKNFGDYIYSDIETLQEVYKIIESCEYAVKALSMPEVLVKKRGKKIIKTYVVDIAPVCFRQRPKDIEELKTAIYQILKVLEIVHDSGYVH